MVLPRASAFKGAFRQSTARTAGARARNQNWRSGGRRFYASGHGAQKASSDLPWLIGSVAVTVPSATWLWQQGPKKGEHGHGHGEHEEHEESEGGEEKSDEKESKDEGGDDSKDEDGDKDEGEEKPKEDTKDESKDDEKSESSGSDEDEDKGEDTPDTTDDEENKKPSSGSPGQINKNSKKGPGEGQKGERAPTEKKGEKDAKGDSSGAKNPYIDDDEKSKKGEGVTDTAKIHGTVDSKRSPG